MAIITSTNSCRKAITLLIAIVSSLQFPSASSFQPSSSTVLQSKPSIIRLSPSKLHAVRDPWQVNPIDDSSSSSSSISRRRVFRLVCQGALVATSLAVMPQISSAAVATPAELKKLQIGHSRVQYLLENWDQLTSTCNNKAISSTESKQVIRTEGGGGGFCDKSPLVVQEYIGYKSIDDPLFKADKIMLKGVSLVDESVMDQEDYVDLVERFREKADQTSLLAYTSSWGEANPNGGKEVVDEYLERTRELVMETEGLLRKVLGALDLEILEPSPKKV
mmetsp:Transcript_29057/g.59154  ORF Transcript_29057/g.59154 Transcript_29057/m.59154 type:complete len:277 (+) Transcript_29057:39-869(+)